MQPPPSRKRSRSPTPPHKRAPSWLKQEDAALAVLVERDGFDWDIHNRGGSRGPGLGPWSEAPALPGRSASECWERWMFFVFPMRYGRRGSPWDKNTATRQLPPQTWGKLPGQSSSLSPAKPMRRVSPWAGQNSRQLPLQTRPPHNPSETLRRMADDLAHHVDGLRQSISSQAPRYSPSLNPQLPSASMDSSLDAAPWSPPPPQLSNFDHLLADASLPLPPPTVDLLPPPTESPYASAPSELEDLFEPALDDGVVPFCWTL